MKNIYKILIFIAIPFLLNACFSLDQEPYKELSEKNSFKSIQDAQFWVNGMYATLRTNVYGRSMYATDAQADFANLARRSSNSDILTEIHNWTLLTSSNGVIATIWQNYFNAIQNINIGLEGIPTIPISAQGSARRRRFLPRCWGCMRGSANTVAWERLSCIADTAPDASWRSRSRIWTATARLLRMRCSGASSATASSCGRQIRGFEVQPRSSDRRRVLEWRDGPDFPCGLLGAVSVPAVRLR